MRLYEYCNACSESSLVGSSKAATARLVKPATPFSSTIFGATSSDAVSTAKVDALVAILLEVQSILRDTIKFNKKCFDKPVGQLPTDSSLVSKICSSLIVCATILHRSVWAWRFKPISSTDEQKTSHGVHLGRTGNLFEFSGCQHPHLILSHTFPILTRDEQHKRTSARIK